MGKGSKRRPCFVSREEWERNFERAMHPPAEEVTAPDLRLQVEEVLQLCREIERRIYRWGKCVEVRVSPKVWDRWDAIRGRPTQSAMCFVLEGEEVPIRRCFGLQGEVELSVALLPPGAG